MASRQEIKNELCFEVEAARLAAKTARSSDEKRTLDAQFKMAVTRLNRFTLLGIAPEDIVQRLNRQSDSAQAASATA